MNKELVLHQLREVLDNCEDFLRRQAHTRNQSFLRILACCKENLPAMLLDILTDKEIVLIEARLKGINIDTPQYHIQALWDVAFDYEDYKAIGYNDGQLSIVSLIASTLGDKELSERASNAMYNQD